MGLIKTIKMVKVNWRKEYLLDNIFNIFIGIMGVVILCIDVSKYMLLIPILSGLYINLSAFGFFNGDKYE